MRTSIEIDDHVFSEAKKLSLMLNKSFGKVIEDALRSMIQKKNRVKKSNISLITMKGKGLNHGVDLDNNESLADIMDN